MNFKRLCWVVSLPGARVRPLMAAKRPLSAVPLHNHFDIAHIR
jgi:hypothetical protein